MDKDSIYRTIKIKEKAREISREREVSFDEAYQIATNERDESDARIRSVGKKVTKQKVKKSKIKSGKKEKEKCKKQRKKKSDNDILIKLFDEINAKIANAEPVPEPTVEQKRLKAMFQRMGFAEGAKIPHSNVRKIDK